VLATGVDCLWYGLFRLDGLFCCGCGVLVLYVVLVVSVSSSVLFLLWFPLTAG